MVFHTRVRSVVVVLNSGRAGILTVTPSSMVIGRSRFLNPDAPRLRKTTLFVAFRQRARELYTWRIPTVLEAGAELWGSPEGLRYRTESSDPAGNAGAPCVEEK